MWIFFCSVFLTICQKKKKVIFLKVACSGICFNFQLAASDGDEFGAFFQVVGHGGHSPPHVPDHKAPAEGEDRGQVG